MDAMPMIARCMIRQNPDILMPSGIPVQREEVIPMAANDEGSGPVDAYIPHA